MHCRTTLAYQFRTRLGFKQHDVISAKKRSLLTKVMSSFEEENLKCKLNVAC